ncbi:hypothetical protein LguiA_009814 [Lonicera macranthoides]
MGESSQSIADLYAHLNLGDSDGLDLNLNEIPNEELNHAPKWCIVGKLVTKHTINFMAIKSIMLSVWNPVMDIWMKELGPNLFLIQFSHEMDLERVIKDGP